MKKKEESGIIEKAEKPRKQQENINHLLIENFTSLQKVMSGMAERFDNLSVNISKLLNLFEASAKSFMSSPAISEIEKDKEFLSKLDALLEQNKTIAKGLTLMEEKFRERVYGKEPEIPKVQVQQPPSNIQNIKKLPRF